VRWPPNAVQLFVERAASARPDFVLDAANSGAVAEVCRRLDGIPLAIELAAARVASMRPADLATRLDERFRLLTGGRRTAVERHQTLRATVDWSYSLCNDVERTVFDRLGVFAGSFDAAGAEAVAIGDDLESWDVLDALTSLVDKSLLVDEATAGGSTRFAMLETLRAYARERLDESTDPDVWRRRYAFHYVTVSGEIARELHGPDERAVRRRLAAELDNFRAAVTWSIDRDDDVDAELGLHIISNLSDEAFANPASGIGLWAERVVDRVESCAPALRISVLGAAASTVARRGDYEAAIALANSALRDGVIPDAPNPAIAILALAFSELVAGHSDAAIDVLLEGATALADAGAPGYTVAQVVASAGSFMGLSLRPEAVETAERAVRLARATENPSIIISALHAQAWALLRVDPAAALQSSEEALGFIETGYSSGGMYGSVAALAARLHFRLGDTPLAMSRLHDAFSWAHAQGDVPQLVAVLDAAVPILARSGREESAAIVAGAVMDGPLAAANNFPTGHYEHGDRVLGPVAEALGTEAYEAAYARGATLARDELLAYVLSETAGD
jgi:hypothetical protein